jgi:hypothetical protein
VRTAFASALCLALACGCGQEAASNDRVTETSPRPSTTSAEAADPAPTPAPSPSAAPATASAAPSAKAAASAPLPKLADDPPAEDKTPRPSAAEWKRAPEVALARNTHPNCTARRLREWLRIACTNEGWGYHSVSLVAGTRGELDMGVRENGPEGAFVVLPLRRGNRRLIQFASRNKWGWDVSDVISEQWLDGDPAPLVTLGSP